MQPTPDFNASRLARSLLRRSRQGALATLMTGSGDPYCSLVNVASHADASPILLISRLALHTKNILADGRVSLMLDERAAGDPLEGARIMLAGRAEEAVGETAKILRRRYLSAHPSAEAFVDFKDFSFFRIAPSGLHLVAGFGRIIDLEPAQFLTEIGDAGGLLEAEQGAVAHMNEDHREAMNLYATRLLDAESADWSLHRLRPRRHGHAGRQHHAAAGFPGTGHQRIGIAQNAGAAGGRGAGQGLMPMALAQGQVESLEKKYGPAHRDVTRSPKISAVRLPTFISARTPAKLRSSARRSPTTASSISRPMVSSPATSRDLPNRRWC